MDISYFDLQAIIKIKQNRIYFLNLIAKTKRSNSKKILRKEKQTNRETAIIRNKFFVQNKCKYKIANKNKNNIFTAYKKLGFLFTFVFLCLVRWQFDGILCKHFTESNPFQWGPVCKSHNGLIQKITSRKTPTHTHTITMKWRSRIKSLRQ